MGSLPTGVPTHSSGFGTFRSRDQCCARRRGGLGWYEATEVTLAFLIYHFTSGVKHNVRVVLLAGSDLIQTMSEPGVWTLKDVRPVFRAYGDS